MLKSYFRITWRNLLKDRQFTALNLIGLSVGLACTLLIGLWVADELHMDKYNEKDAQLYQVMGNFKTDAGIKTGTHTSGILAPALKKEIPEIEQVIAAAAAAENLFLAAHGLGYGVMWKTGAAAYDAGVKAAIGLGSEDHIVGIMHLGTRLK